VKKVLGKLVCVTSVVLLTITAHWAMAAPPVQVTAADPSAAPQGTISLDVTVSGSGFDSSAAVNFYVTGSVNPGGITVKKVAVKGSKQLIATIDIADSAVVDKFDIEVALSGGRKGKGTTLFSVQPKETGKPAPEPLPLPPPGSCSGAPGVFPAFAYAKSRVLFNKNGRRSVEDGEDLYIADSTGSCSVRLLSDKDIFRVNYRQIGNEALIVWKNGSSTEIRLLRIPINSGYVVPIQPAVIYSTTSSGHGVFSPVLSKDGRTVYFVHEYSPADQHWQDTLNSIDIASCAANCTPQVIYTPPIDVGLGGLSINDADDRIYMSIHDRVPDIRTVSFLQKQAGVWTSLRHVVSNRDSPYLSIRGFAATAIGRWDYQSSSVPKDVLAYQVDYSSSYVIDIIDVSNCSATGTLSCYGSGESALVRSGIVGIRQSFTSAPASSDPAPNLLVQLPAGADGEPVIGEIDLDSMAVTPLLQGHAANSSD
jgi:hypothetical protein